MTTKAAPHTLFELSLLLSALQKYGVDQTSFQKISTEFTKSDVISEDVAYDAARFAPDSLQSLYLQVLKDEVRAASQYAAQQAKRKKSPTPPLQSLDEARKHKHLLPGLAKRYHTKYVEQVTKEIVEDEKAFFELVQEIDILEKQPQDGQAGKNISSISSSAADIGTINGANGTNTPHKSDLATSRDIVHNLQQESRSSTQRPEGSSPANGQPTSTTSQHPKEIGPSQVPSTSRQVNPRTNTPSTPNNQQRPLAPFKGSSNTPGIESSGKPSYTGHWSNVQPSKGNENAPSPTQSLPLPSYASNFTPGVTSVGTPSQRHPHFGTFDSTPATQPPNRGPLPLSFTPLPSKLFGNITPAGGASDRRRFHGLTPLETPQSSTRWKELPRNAVREGRSPPRPGNSPYLSDSPTPEPEAHDTGRISSNEPHRASDTPTRGRGRGRWPNRGRGRGGRLNADSPSSRVRSQSAMSGAEDSAAEGTGRKLKTEPPATPGFGDEAISFVSTPGESKPGVRRRDALRDGETPKQGLKRKRADTMDGTPDAQSIPKFSRPGQVLASRNFPRIVSALLNDINSHKLASVFAKPISEKSAPGYTGLIYRPQDLKSIRSSISAGSRFVATVPDPEASTEEGNGGDTPAAATPSAITTKASNIWVERTAEVIPPKGIVNSAQLEKELCRMLANAVMYNPDPKRGFGPSFRMTQPSRVQDDEDIDMEDEDDLDDGRLVNDAREMFESVEQAVSAWRAAERINPGDGGNKGSSEKVEDQGEDTAENTATEGGDGEKSSLRRSTRG